MRIADIGCGSGATTLAVRRRAPPGSRVEGFDISPTLVEVARSRAGHDTLTFETADVAARALPEVPYDRLVTRFGIMFFDDPPAAFARLRRWLAVNGRFAFAVWGPPDDNPWATTVRDVVAGLVELPAPLPDAPGPFRYGDAPAFTRLLADAGFAAVAVGDWRGELPIGAAPSASAAARYALSAFSTFAHAIAAAGEATAAEAQRRLTDRFDPHTGADGQVRMAARVHIVTGRSDGP